MPQILVRPKTGIPLLLLASLALGAVFAAVDAVGAFWPEWLAASLLLWIGLLLAVASMQWTGAGRAVIWMVIAAFLARILVGFLLFKMLPVAGYADNAVHQAGYVYYDAYHRDAQAWQLAGSGNSLLEAFTADFANDQYGGLLSVSALIYRYLSPDVQRPMLIVLLGAIAAALGVPYLWAAVRPRWGGTAAGIAGWILALYPESILLGSSQMREPFLITFVVLAFWAISIWQKRLRAALITLAVSLAGVFLFSWRVGLVALAFLAVWAWLDFVAGRTSPRWQVLGWAGLAVAALAIVALSWPWLRDAMKYDVSLALSNSGWVQKLVKELGGQRALVPFVAVYGIAQPVLPAAVADPSPMLLRVMGSLRALGWYALAPFLVYALFTVWKVKADAERRLLVWAALAVWLWVVISSLRGGGDQWDNPRYRTIFLLWMALLAGWAYVWAREHRDAWLWRWLAVEGIFLLFFTDWYASRYYHIVASLNFWVMVALILILSTGVLVGGWIWDRRKKKVIDAATR
jgi:hypothetical protein